MACLSGPLPCDCSEHQLATAHVVWVYQAVGTLKLCAVVRCPSNLTPRHWSSFKPCLGLRSSLNAELINDIPHRDLTCTPSPSHQQYAPVHSNCGTALQAHFNGNWCLSPCFSRSRPSRYASGSCVYVDTVLYRNHVCCTGSCRHSDDRCAHASLRTVLA